MKALIRNWLGITEPNMNSYVSKAELSAEVSSAVWEALKPNITADYGFSFWDFDTYTALRGTMENTIGKTVEDATKAEVERILAPEDFIDSVVARIKAKQLSS